MKMRSQLRPQGASGSGDQVVATAAAAAIPTTRSTGGAGGSGGGGSSTTTTTIATSSCQDCGNKAKRDCVHNRCRTCCKSRGFHCPTHVKSTWVPVSRRRQRLHQHHHHHLSLLDPEADHHHFFPLTRSLSGLRDISPPSPGGMEGRGGGGGHLPTELNTTATFRCVRVSSEDNVLDQCAYQTSVNIGGHLFKGILYDQGPVGAVFGGSSTGGVGGGGGGDSSSSEHQIPHHHFLHRHLHLQQPHGSGGSGGSGSGGVGVNLLYPPPPTSSLYPAVPFNAFMTPGMQFFPHPRP